MESITEKLNEILKSELYNKIKQTIDEKFCYDENDIMYEDEEDENEDSEFFEIKSNEHLNRCLDMIYIRDKAISIYKKNKIITEGFDFKYYKTIKNYHDILKNGMTCIKFLCKLYRELLVYEALLLQKGHTNIGLSGDIYEIVRCIIFYRHNYPDEKLKFENNFLIKLAVNIEKYLDRGGCLIRAANETRIHGFVPFDKSRYQDFKNLDMYHIKTTDEWIITNDDPEEHTYEGFDLQTDY